MSDKDGPVRSEMFIAQTRTNRAKLQEVRNVMDAEHSAPRGAIYLIDATSYKHFAPDGAKTRLPYSPFTEGAGKSR